MFASPRHANLEDLERFIVLEKQIEALDGARLLRRVKDSIVRAGDLELSIRERVERIEGCKSSSDSLQIDEWDGTEENAPLLDMETDYLLLASDQREYDALLKYIRSGTADLFDYNILAEEFHLLLNALFSDCNTENILEERLREAQDAVKRQEQSFEEQCSLWTEVQKVSELVLKAVRTWSSLKKELETESSRKLLLTKQTRCYVVRITSELQSISGKIEELGDSRVEMTGSVVARLSEFLRRIPQMYATDDGVSEGLDILLGVQKDSRQLEQFVFEKLNVKEWKSSIKTLKDVVIEASIMLRKERRKMIREWLMEYDKELPDSDGEEDNGKSEEDASTLCGEELSIDELEPESYDNIVTGVKLREKQSELENLRAGLDLQDKMRLRRLKQRHKRAQDFMNHKE